MADAYWMQLGRYPTFALEVAGQIVGITDWLDAERLVEGEARVPRYPTVGGTSSP
jgi:hypothetical protein